MTNFTLNDYAAAAAAADDDAYINVSASMRRCRAMTSDVIES